MSVLDSLYSKFIGYMNLGGVYPYSYQLPGMKFSVSLNGFHHLAQLGNFIFILGMMTCHGGLILSTTQFLTDINKVNLLIQLPWIVGLPLSLAVNCNEIFFRDLICSGITAWRQLEHSVLENEVSSQPMLKKQENFVRLQLGLYTVIWATAVMSFFVFFWAVSWFPGFVTSMLEPEDEGTSFGWSWKLAFGLLEPYMIHCYWMALMGFDILVGSMCHSICTCLDQLGSNLDGARGSRRFTAVFEETILSYKGFSLLVANMNEFLSLCLGLQKGILLVLQGIMLHGAIKYYYRPEVFIPYFTHFLFFNVRMLSLFMPIGRVHQASRGFLSQLNSYIMISEGGVERRLLRAQLKACRVLGINVCSFYPVKRKSILQYLCFLTTYVFMIVTL